MNKFKKWFGILKDSLEKGYKRFPLTIAFSIALVVMGIYFNHADDKTYLEKIIFPLMIGVPLSGCLGLIFNKDKKGMGIQFALSFIVVLVYGLWFPLKPTDVLYEQHFALNWILYACFFLIPYLKNQSKFSNYIFYNVGKFFLTVLYALILFAGTSAVYFTIDVLFELNLSDEIYFDLFLISAGVFGTMHFLGHLPSEDKRDLPYTTLFERLFLYIVLPLLCIYTVILHAYFIKILIAMTLPKGMIGNLVVWYGLVGILTWFFLNELRDKYIWLDKIGKFYAFGMIAPLGMLFVAVSIRIFTYGFTLLRFMLLLAGLFEVISFVLLLLKRERANVYIGVLGVAFIAITFFGPLSGNNIAINSQNKILKEKIELYNAYDANGNVNISALDQKSQSDINNTASYIVDHYDYLELYFADAAIDTDMQALENRTGLDLRYSRYYYDNQDVEYIDVYDEALSNFVDLEGADYMFKYNSYNQLSVKLEPTTITLNKYDSPAIEFKSGSASVSIDMDSWYLEMNDANSKIGEKTVSVDGHTLSLKWVVYSMNGTKENGMLSPKYLESYLLITVQN